MKYILILLALAGSGWAQLTITPAAVSIYPGESAQLTASEDVTWTSANTTYAKVNAAGLVTTSATQLPTTYLTAGYTLVRATSKADATRTATVRVTVRPPEVPSVPEFVIEGANVAHVGLDAYWKMTPRWTASPDSVYVSVTAPAELGLTWGCDGKMTCVSSGGRKYLWGGAGYVKARFHPTTPGSYPVTLTAETTRGAITSVSGTVTVLPPGRAPAPPIDPAIKATWEKNMRVLANKWCIPDEKIGFGWEGNVYFYDGAKVYFNVADYLNDPKYTACAMNIARQYRDYVMANRGMLPQYRVFPHGLWMAFERTGDPSYRTAALALRANVGFLTQTWQTSTYMRETAYSLQTYTQAALHGETVDPRMHEAAANLLSQINHALYGGHNGLEPVIRQSYWDGLAMAALIEYHEVTADPRVPVTVAALCADLHANWWSGAQMQMNKAPLGPSCAWGCVGQADNWNTDLINLIAPAYAWLYQRTGEDHWLRMADEIWSHHADTPLTWSGKTFSQNYRWSFDFVRWRQ